jgi:hypothetical protein
VKITRDMMIAGGERWAKVFAALEAMGESDGRRETILKLWREVYPQHDWADAEFSLFVYQQSGYIAGLTFEDKHLVEPIVTEHGRREKARLEETHRKLLDGEAFEDIDILE